MHVAQMWTLLSLVSVVHVWLFSADSVDVMMMKLVTHHLQVADSLSLPIPPETAGLVLLTILWLFWNFVTWVTVLQLTSYLAASVMSFQVTFGWVAWMTFQQAGCSVVALEVLKLAAEVCCVEAVC